jgi:hypothetical protein
VVAAWWLILIKAAVQCSVCVGTRPINERERKVGKGCSKQGHTVQLFIQLLAKQEVEVGKQNARETAHSTQPIVVCPSVRTWSAQISEMAERIWLKFGDSAQEGWQSVLHKKKPKKTIKTICGFSGIFL